MKIVYHPSYLNVYSSDPAAKAGRMESLLLRLEGVYEFVLPQTAKEEDLLRVHSPQLINSVKSDNLLFEVASLSAGGAIKAGELAMENEPSFALIRPPGHHAGKDKNWGFCYFNNLAVALAKLKEEGKIKNALIVDFDMHYGDGTQNIFKDSPMIYLFPEGKSRQEYMENLQVLLQKSPKCDLLAISAGFDRHEADWGGLLKTKDYTTIGSILKDNSLRFCEGKRFAVLEGGYNHTIFGHAVKSFLEGFE